MLNIIWGGMILLSLIIATFTGNLEACSAAAAEGAKNAVETCITLLGIMCLWSGFAKIGERAGLITAISKLLHPLLKRLFPHLSEDNPARGSMVLNLVANLFGMGNAATPLGIRAMEDLQKSNPLKTVASNEMCLFAVLNTASLQLVPTTLISLRQMYGSENPGEIILPIWLVSIAALCVGIFVAKLLERRSNL